MTETTADLPDWIEEELSYNDDYDIQDDFFVEPLVETDQPWLSRQTIEDEVGVSDENARERLGQLVEKGVLESAWAANGRIYWINDERSEWPIPPDVELVDEQDEGKEGEREELQEKTTIDDFLNRSDVRIGIATVLVALVSSLLIGLGVAPIIGGYDAAGIEELAELSLVLGFLGALLATMMIIVTLFAFVGRKAYQSTGAQEE